MTAGERRLREMVEARWPDRRVLNSRGVPARIEGDGPADWPRNTSQRGALAAALETGRVVLVPDAVVREVLLSANGARASGVRAIAAGTRQVYDLQARAVVLAASTLETTRLLLNSRNGDGLGNSSGTLGCFLMDHPVRAVSEEVPDLPALATPPPQKGPDAIVIPRFCNLRGRDSTFAGGFGIWGGVQRDVVPPGQVARNGRILLIAYGEMLPRPDSRVTLDPSVVDCFGIPALHIRCGWSDNERAMIRQMDAALAETVEAIGASLTAPLPSPHPGGMVHEVGTARMGRDRRRSVVDPHNRLWDVENVLVVDGACWPSSGWQNPTLTMMAITARACSHLADAFGGHPWP
jgi:choline dehydrogenase-like flavoprotein